MWTSLEDAVKHVRSSDRVFIHTAAAAPSGLINALTNRASELQNVHIYHLHTEGEAPYSSEKYKSSFNVQALFIGGNVRKAIHEGRGSYIPVFLSEAPALFRRGIIAIDVALISVSPPDKHGYCSLGISVDSSKAAVESAKIVIAEVNENMPRTHGDGLLHFTQIDYAVKVNTPILEVAANQPTEVEMAIGRNVTEYIENGATLQMGIGAIPNAVLHCLKDHRDLGIHTEMFTDGLLPLIESGVINGVNKASQVGMIVSTFLMGTRSLYDFVDDNPLVQLLDANYVNDTSVIRKHPKMTAINSAIEIDLSGQVCADSLGYKVFSGVGGQMDFIRGASLSEGGKPIIALPSTTRKGISRIVPLLHEGAGVVTTRAHVHYVATEYGVVNLYGKTLRRRAELLCSISHPDHREFLERETQRIYPD